MADSTALPFALWPCLELVRQYELLRVRSLYEKLCGRLLHRELHRVRTLIRKEEATVQQGGELPKGFEGALFPEKRPETASDLTPKESFNRWLMECRSMPVEHADPLIPSVRCGSKAKVTCPEAAAPDTLPNDDVKNFVERPFSSNCATEPARVANAIVEGRMQVHNESLVQRLNNKEVEGAILLPYRSASAVSESGTFLMECLEREILEDLPMKVSIGSAAAKTRTHLIEYARAVSAIMLAEKQKIQRVSLAALSALVEALLVILRGEREDDPYKPRVPLSDTVDSHGEGAAHILSFLSSELQQARHNGGVVSAHCNAREGGRARLKGGEVQEVETASRCTNTSSGESKEIRKQLEVSWKGCLHASKLPCTFEGAELAQEYQIACSDDETATVTASEDHANGQFAEEVDNVLVDEALLCTSLAPDSTPQNLHAESYRLSKDGVYHLVCLARPVLTAIYGSEVRALVENVKEAAQHAGARVAQYAACLTAGEAADGEPSASCLNVITSTAVRAAGVHSGPREGNAQFTVPLPQRHGGQKDACTATRARPTGDQGMTGGDERDTDELAAGARVPSRSDAVFHKEAAGCLGISVSRQPSAVRGAEDRGLYQLFNTWRAGPPCASGKHLVFHNIRWSSCRVHERFMYDGEVEMLAPDKCESVCMDSFRSFKSTYSIKSYKVVQLWARFILQKLGHECKTLAEVDCMRTECVCQGRGVCGGDWTCSCVRRQIERIQCSAYAGDFAVLIFCLLCRYYTVCGCRRQGKGLHSAIPGEIMQVLKQRVGVECELFASPLNACLHAYCSLFPDIDRFFGSRGSFFDPNFTIEEGSYEANPPFEESIMKRVVLRIEQWLHDSRGKQYQTSAQRPLSFCLFVPYWRAGPSQYLAALLRSKYMRFSTVLPEEQHYFLSGFEYFCPSAKIAKASVCKTVFAVLQNDAGARKWPITPEIIEQIKTTWRPDHNFVAGVRKRGEGIR